MKDGPSKKTMNCKIEAMHQRFGTCGVFCCKTCSHLLRVIPTSRVVYKCELYGDTRGESTDWRLSYPACGMYDMVVDIDRWEPVIERLKHAPRAYEPPLDGQMDFSSILSER